MTKELCDLIQRLNEAISRRMSLEVDLYDCKEHIEHLKDLIKEEIENVR